MAKHREGWLECSPEEFSEALGDLLDQYNLAVVEGIKHEAKQAAKEMMRLTTASAPRRYGRYASAITYEVAEDSLTGISVTWGVAGKKGNLSHLLERGHQTKSGSRTKAFRFIEPALEKAKEQYLAGIKKAVEDAAK